MPFDARFQRPGFLGSISVARPVLGLAAAAACFLIGTTGVQAQQTVIIGGGGPAPSGVYGGAPASTIGQGGSGIEVNSSVLDSLGPGPAGALPLPNQPLAAPQRPVYGAGIAAPGTTGQSAGGAYRLPGTGELVVTRPSTLLYPPLQAPQSRLAVPLPRSAPKQQAAAGGMSDGKLKSRLISEPPKQPLKQLLKQSQPKAKPAVAAKKPAAPKVAAPAAPAKPKAMASAPAMPSLTEEVRSSAAPAAPKTVNPPVSASIAPAPKPEAAAAPKPKAAAEPAPRQRTASVAPPPPPSLLTPSPAAPSPAAPSPAAPSVAAPSVTAPSIAAPSVAAPSVTAPSVAAPGGSAPKEIQSASRTTGASSGTVESSGGKMRLTFAPGSAELSDDAKRELQGLAKSLVQNASSRVQLLAYAADSGDGASRARRMSLSRALAVRAFLIDQGVRSNRMDVRAQGSKVGDGPADRVDIFAR